MKSILISSLLLILTSITTYSQNWTELNTGYSGTIKKIEVIDDLTCLALTGSFDDYLLYTYDGGIVWTMLPFGQFTPSDIDFYDTQNGIITGYDTDLGKPSLCKTTDGGATWDEYPQDINARFYSAVLLNPQYCIIGGVDIDNSSGMIWISEDGCQTFTPASGDFPAMVTSLLFTTPLKGFCSGSDKTSLTLDGGYSWYETLPSGGDIHFVDSLFGFCASEYLYKTTNGGSSWSTMTSLAPFSSVWFIDHDQGWLTSEGNILSTTDGGDNWVIDLSGYPDFKDIEFSDNGAGYAVGESGAVVKKESGAVPVELSYFSLDIDGAGIILKWKTATETNNFGFSIYRKENEKEKIKLGFVEGKGTTTQTQEYSFFDYPENPGSYIYFLEQIDLNGGKKIIGQKKTEFAITPEKFRIYPNYPNPFNPSTNLSFEIPEDCYVILNIYDIQGRRIKSLVNEKISAGRHNTTIDMDTNPGGVYFYHLQAGDYNGYGKLLLVK